MLPISSISSYFIPYFIYFIPFPIIHFYFIPFPIICSRQDISLNFQWCLKIFLKDRFKLKSKLYIQKVFCYSFNILKKQSYLQSWWIALIFSKVKCFSSKYLISYDINYRIMFCFHFLLYWNSLQALQQVLRQI